MGPQHNWKFEGCHPHNGEYWYKCSICGVSDWIAGYGTLDQLQPAECKGPPTNIPSQGDTNKHEDYVTKLEKEVERLKSKYEPTQGE